MFLIILNLLISFVYLLLIKFILWKKEKFSRVQEEKRTSRVQEEKKTSRV